MFDAHMDADGSVTLAGQTSDDDIIIFRADKNGLADQSFGSNGKLVIDPALPNAQAMRIYVGPDGRIAVAGHAEVSAGDTTAVLAVLKTHTIPDINTTGSDFSAGGNAFGACLRATGAGANTDSSTWTSNSTCALTNGAWWNAISTSYGAFSKVAMTSTAGSVEATASLRFGVELDGTEPPGRYVAPITVEVVAPNLDPPVNTVRPAISGTAQEKQLLTASTGTWTGSPTITYSYQWQRCTPTCSDIAGETSANYRPIGDDVGHTLRTIVTAKNDVGSKAEATLETSTVLAAPPLSPFYVTGFEHQSTSTAGGGIVSNVWGGGTSTPDTTTKHAGSSSMRFTASSNIRQWDVDVPAGSFSTASARMYIYISQLPSAPDVITVTEFESISSDYCEIQIAHDGTLRSRIFGGTVQIGPTIQLNRWYRLDYSCDFSSATNRLKWSVDGTSQTDATLINTPHTLANVQIGIDTTATMDIRYDDVIATTSAADYPIGPGHVVAITPDGTGTHSIPGNFGWSTNNGGSWTALTAADSNQSPGSAAYIDEWPVMNADGIRATATSGYLEYTFADVNSSKSINAVSLVAAERGGAGMQVTLAIDGGGGFQPVLANTLPGTSQIYRATMATVPVSGNPWSGAALDAMRMRFSSSNASVPPRVDSVIAEVDIAGGSAPVNTSLPTISGSQIVGRTLSASPGTWNPADATFSYQWQRCTPACTDISGANASTYVLAVADQGNQIQVTVTASAGGDTESAVSPKTAMIGAGAPTLVAFDGFEAGQLHNRGNLYDSIVASNGTVDTDRSIVRNGSHAARIQSNGGAGSTAIEWNLGTTVGVMRVSMRLDQAPTSGGLRELLEFNNADSFNCEINYDPATKVIGANITNSRQVGPNLEVGRWYDIDWRCDTSGAIRRLHWAIDGVPQTPVVNNIGSASTINFSVIGNTNGGTGAYVARYDDVAVSTTLADFPIGRLAIDPMHPWKTSTHNTIANFSYSTNGGALWNPLLAEDDTYPGSAAYLDDTPTEFTAGVSGEMVRQTIAGGYLAYALPNTDRAVAPVSVRGIGVHSAADPSVAQNSTLTAYVPPSTSLLYSGDPANPANSLWGFRGIMNIKPSGGAWDIGGVNDLELRLSSTNVSTNDARRPVTHTILAEAAYPTGEAAANALLPKIRQPWGSVKVGDELEVEKGTWSSLSPFSLEWIWMRCNSLSEGCVPIAGAISPKYTVQPADVGMRLRVTESAKNEAGAQSARSAATGVAATPPTFEYLSGFESGVMSSSPSGISVTGTPPSFSTISPHSGTYSADYNSGMTNIYNYSLPPSTTVAVMRTYVRLSATNPPVRSMLVEIGNTVSDKFCDIDILPSGQLSTSLYSTPTDYDQQTSAPIAANRWYLLDVRLDASTTTWRCDWSLDGVPQISSTHTWGSTWPLTEAGISTFDSVVPKPRFDDWAISVTNSDYPIGPGVTQALRPQSDAAHSGFASFNTNAGGVGVNEYQRLDETPAWSIIDWVGQTSNSSTSYLEFLLANPSDRSTAARTISGLVGYHSSGLAANNGAAKVVRLGDTDASAPYIQNGDMSETSIQWTNKIVPAPAGGWTVSELDGLRLRVGYSTNAATNPRWEAAAIEVEYRR